MNNIIKDQDCFVFDEAYEFRNGRAKVNKGEYWGEINRKGQWIIKIKCEEFSRINNNLIIIKINDKYGCINNHGKWIIEPQYDDMFRFYGMKHLIVKKNNLWGTIDFKNKIIIDLIYDELNVAHDKYGYFCAKSGTKYGFVDKFGKEILPFKYDKSGYISYEKQAFVNYDNYWHLINIKNKKDINLKCTDYNILSNKTIAVKKDDEKWIIINYKNKLVCDKKFDDINTNGLRMDRINKARIGDKYGFIDNCGKTIIDFQYKNIWCFLSIVDCKLNFNKGYCPVTLDGAKWGLINEKGKLIIPFEYDSIELWYKKYLIVQKNGKIGVIDWNGKIIIDFIYDFDEFLGIDEGYITLSKNEKYGFVKLDGSFLKINKESFENPKIELEIKSL